MFIRLTPELKMYVDRYKRKVIESLKDYKYKEEKDSTNHTIMLTKAGKGNKAAQEYVKKMICKIIENPELINSNVRSEIRQLVISQYKIINDCTYKSKNLSEGHIDYYQLIDNYMVKQEREKLKFVDLERINGTNEFVDLLYCATYGNGLLETLFDLNINNIEVHDTFKIRIETLEGLWVTIDDYKFDDDDEVKRIARNLAGESSDSGVGGDITEEDCEFEGERKDRSRITIALKPAAEMDFIAIKMFKAFKVTGPEILLSEHKVSEQMYKEMQIYARYRANAIFIGGVNVGKTTFLKAYVGLIPDKYKIRMVESDFETHLQTLYPNKDIRCLRETSKYTLNDQFMKLLRSNGDILGIGEVRSYEVLEFIKSMLRGCDGSFTTAHTRSSRDTVDNLAFMTLEDGKNRDIRFERLRVARALDLTYRIKNIGPNKRIIDSIDEIENVYDNIDFPYKTRQIFTYDIDKDKFVKVNCVTDDLIEKFKYYGCTKSEVDILRSI